MIIGGPLGELDLCDRLRLEPDTVLISSFVSAH